MDRYATSGDDIYAARVSSTGTMLDPAGIAVSSAPGNQHNPRVAFDGTNFLVVWETDGDDADIHGARLGPDGQVLAPGEFEITAAEGDQRASSVAFNGAGYIVLWADERSGTSSDIYGVRVTTGGVVERTRDLRRRDHRAGRDLSATRRHRNRACGVVGVGEHRRCPDHLGRSGSRRRRHRDLQRRRLADVPGRFVRRDELCGRLGRPSLRRQPRCLRNACIGCGRGARCERNTDLGKHSRRGRTHGRIRRDEPRCPLDGRGGYWETGQESVRAARLTPSGTVIDPDGLAVASTEWTETRPAAVGLPTGKIGVTYQREEHSADDSRLAASGGSASARRLHGSPRRADDPVRPVRAGELEDGGVHIHRRAGGRNQRMPDRWKCICLVQHAEDIQPAESGRAHVQHQIDERDRQEPDRQPNLDSRTRFLRRIRQSIRLNSPNWSIRPP